MSKELKTTIFNLRCPIILKEELRKLAVKRGTTMTDIIICFLKQELGYVYEPAKFVKKEVEKNDKSKKVSKNE